MKGPLHRPPCASAAANEVAKGQEGGGGPAVVWFKQDLRLDDNPALLAAACASTLTPVYVLDPDVLRGTPKELLGPLLDALSALRADLEAAGSGLVVRTGSAPGEVANVVAAVGATAVYAEEEVEDRFRQSLAAVSDALGQPAAGGRRAAVALHLVECQLYEMEELASDDFREYKKAEKEAICPLEAPLLLPPLPQGLATGAIPSLEELLSTISCAGPLEHASPSPSTPTDVAVPCSEQRAADLLEGYLQFGRPAAPARWQSLHEQMAELERSPGTSFGALFGGALSLGLLSRRRIRHLAAAVLQGSRPGSRSAAAAALRSLDAHEWHARLARRELASANGRRGGGHVARFWRWNSVLAEYAVAGEEGGGPPILLVHGFGAFWAHFGAAMDELAARGFRVWAVTLPGFGRSEKAFLPYSQDVWAAFVRDFVTCVVREPVVLGGNSIGGYMAASVAGDFPHLVSSLVLFNSAGRLLPDYPRLLPPSPPPQQRRAFENPRPVSWALSSLLFMYLQRNVPKILRRCYPKDTGRVDQRLIDEIVRASHDPGALEVVQSVFYLPKPRPLNMLLDAYGGPVLLVQGKLDPLNDAVARAQATKALCPSVTVHLVDAGHCPHDEAPEEVAAILDQWLRGESVEGPADAALGAAARTVPAGTQAQDGDLVDILGRAAAVVGAKDPGP